MGCQVFNCVHSQIEKTI